jgi:hypothetical protein
LQEVHAGAFGRWPPWRRPSEQVRDRRAEGQVTFSQGHGAFLFGTEDMGRFSGHFFCSRTSVDIKMSKISRETFVCTNLPRKRIKKVEEEGKSWRKGRKKNERQ